MENKHILDRMKAGSSEEALSHFWDVWAGGKSQDATFWPWLVLLFFSEAVLSEGWFSRAPVSSRSDMLQRAGGSLGFHCPLIRTSLSCICPPPESSILKQKGGSFLSKASPSSFGPSFVSFDIWKICPKQGFSPVDNIVRNWLQSNCRLVFPSCSWDSGGGWCVGVGGVGCLGLGLCYQSCLTSV